MPTHLAAPAAPAAPARYWLGRLSDVVLTTDDKQRRCLTVLLLASLVKAISVALLAFGAMSGMVRAHDVTMVGLLLLVTIAGFYVAIRSGWNRRCADPTLSFAQTIAAQTLIAAVYAISGPMHPAALSVFALVLVFGMFSMRVEAVRTVCLYTLVLVGSVMAWRARTDPHLYPARLEIIYFVLLATVLGMISHLSAQLMGMRQRLKTQKAALENALARIQQIATRDELTGLPNRRNMMDQLHEHALRRARGGSSFYVAMVDLDHFKEVNDTYGHAVGDDTLRAFACQAQSVLRNTDIIGRWGGEEFLLLLPETPPGEPTVGIERLRARLATLAVCPAVPELRVRFSAGFTRYREGEPVDLAIERADRALYESKAGGRNRTVVL
ncbi:GGDEF domain-containing protein [Massilia horti]|uniref:diguanylate cyclase n=1 Tax=Massilia horti TaxID=2562153 RepID=A0A4Y9T832_9BURK|nr:diguanylate cyclase [Massilia horti]TFW35688.1 sensor domain-containing diguanylate cyclase [Massilia horti]